MPLERFHLSIDAPGRSPLQTIYRQIPDAAVRKTTTQGAVHIECDLGPLKPRKNFEFSLPPDVSVFPYIAFSTAQSWQTLAARYSDIVEKQIESADVKALVGSFDPGATPLEIAARLITELHRNVRYTGVEFGESAVIPARPGEVLQRRFGDCKDKSALLVAMLRAAGLHANIALLKSGVGQAVDAALPGLDLFDHAIVWVDSPQPLWIDATASHARAGVLPIGDQGRLALIAAMNTTGLVKIPEQANVLNRRTHDIRFKDFGPGSITEVMESNGPSEMYLRSAYAANDNAKTALERYVKSAFAAKKIGAYELSGKDDLGQPVRVSVEAVETPQVMTTADSAQVVLGPNTLFAELPYDLRESGEALSNDPDPKRANDFLFDQAGVTEHIYRLHPPALYKAGSLPQDSNLQFGPLRLSRSYRKEADGVVEVRYDLEVPKRRISPAEYEQIRESYRKYSPQFADRINFVPETAELLAIGQTSKALSLMRESVAKSEGDATRHIRLSRVLVSAGLGIPARAEAEGATRLDPASSQAWQALAWAWQNDSFGRLRQGDWNRAEALKALRKAVELDPEDRIAKADLAILLEYNEAGERYGKGADLVEAISLYRDLLKQQLNPVVESNLTAALLYNGQLDQAAEEARKCPDNQRILFETTIQAIREGPGPAIVAVQSAIADPVTRGQYLVTTAFTMIHFRRYADAQLLVQAASRATNVPQAAALSQMLLRLKRFEDAKFPDSDPRSVEQKLLALLIGGERLSTERLEDLLAFGPADRNYGEELKSVRRQIIGGFRTLTALGLTAENFVDIALGEISLVKEGDEQHGYRIFSSRLNGSMPAMFVVRQGSYKIIGSTDSMEMIGHKVLDLLKRNDIESAQWWLDHTIPNLADGPDGWLPSSRGLWSGVVPETRGADAIKLAAASLIGRYEGSSEAIAILKDGSPKAKNAIDRGQIDLALCEAYSKAKRWTELTAAAKRLMTSRTFDTAGYGYLMRSLQEQGDWKGLEAAALEQTRAKSVPRDAWQYVAIARIRLGNATGAAEAIEKFKPSASGSEAVELAAWNRILQRKVTEETLESVQTTDGQAQAQVRNPYLVALIDLALRKTENAQDALKQAIENIDADAIDARAWVIYGTICDQYGFPEAAATAWARARASEAGTREIQWTLATIQPSAH